MTVSLDTKLQMSSGMKNNTECMEKDFMLCYGIDNGTRYIINTLFSKKRKRHPRFQLLTVYCLLSAFCIGQFGLHVGLRLHHFLNAICVVLNASLVFKHLSFQGLRRLHERCDLPF